jgi:DNA invertase Pin-like site-specific DNA recombinase
MLYGYARVSSDAQDYTAQVEALKAAGCERIFSEKASGKSTSGRPEFGKLMRALLPGDAVVVTKLDRLARSSRDLHNILGQLRELDCGFVSLGEGWCDTTSDVGRLMITIMGGIAEFERGLGI